MDGFLGFLAGAAARQCAVVACATAAALTPGAAPPRGTAAVLEVAALPPVRPERSLLLGIARVGQRLVAVGEQGVIALSDDHGRSWRNAASVPVNATLTAVRFADAQRGWAIGHLGVVLRTDDSGEHWVKQLDGVGIAHLAIDQARTAPATLAPADAQRLAEDGPDKPLLDLRVQDREHVTLVGAYNLALGSSDGGARWRIESQRFANDKGLHLYGLATTPAGEFAVGEQGLILKAAGGRFAALKPPYDGSLFGVLASGDGVLVHGLRGHAFVSRDGGASWQRSTLPGSGASINAAVRLQDGRLVLGDQAGGVFISADGGSRFERVPFAWGAPITGLVEAADGAIVATSVAGLARLSASTGTPR